MFLLETLAQRAWRDRGRRTAGSGPDSPLGTHAILPSCSTGLSPDRASVLGSLQDSLARTQLQLSKKLARQGTPTPPPIECLAVRQCAELSATVAEGPAIV